MNLSSQKSAIALSASAAALLMPVSAFAEDGAAGADILIPKMAEFIPALIAFLIIWIVLAKVALPGIMKTMEERGKKIEESLDEAEKTKQEAIAKRAESDSIVTDARRQAADIVLEARKDAESERARIIEAAHKEAEEIEFGQYIAPVIDALRVMGVRADFNGRNDLTIDGKKFSGNAQYRLGDCIVHHGSLLFDTDIAQMVASTTETAIRSPPRASSPFGTA